MRRISAGIATGSQRVRLVTVRLVAGCGLRFPDRSLRFSFRKGVITVAARVVTRTGCVIVPADCGAAFRASAISKMPKRHQIAGNQRADEHHGKETLERMHECERGEGEDFVRHESFAANVDDGCYGGRRQVVLA